MKKEIQKRNNWYQKLLEDLKKLEFTGIVLTKWNIGKRILKDFNDNGKPKKGRGGNRRIQNIAKDLGVGTTDIYDCISFKLKYKDSDAVGKLLGYSWRHITHKLLPESKKPKPTMLPLPIESGKNNIIYADPAWKYWEGGYKNQSQHYETMDLEDMKKIKIQDIAADNCILFLWATFPYMKETLELIESWGFNYSTIGFLWVKSKKDRTGFAFGCGSWTRANAELCLIATRGKVERLDASISQIIYEPRREHSRKPDIVRKKIIQLVGDLPRIELFAREQKEGFKVWGNEVSKFSE